MITTNPLLNSLSIGFNTHGQADYLQYDDELSHWNELLEKVKQKPYFKKSPTNLMQCLKAGFKGNQITWDEGVSIRDQFKPAYSKIIKWVSDKFIPPESNILELGSNTIDFEGYSFLASVLPENLVERMYFSDFIPEVVFKYETRAARPYLLIDARKIGRALLQEKPNVIISLSTLDTLERTKLEQVASSAFRALNHGGTFIVLNDRQIHPPPLIEDYYNEDRFAFFTFDDHNWLTGLCYVPRNLAQRRFKEHYDIMPAHYSAFIKTFMLLPLAQQKGLLYSDIRENPSLNNFFASFFSATEVTNVLLEESYYNVVISSLSKAGFSIVFEKKLSASSVAPIAPHREGVNNLFYNMGLIRAFQNDEISAGSTKVGASIYAVVARKP